MYRATFPLSFKEIKLDAKKDNWKVFFGTCIGISVGVVLSEILRRTCEFGNLGRSRMAPVLTV